MQAIFGFSLIGFLLLAAEVLFPGTVLGILGFIALCIAVGIGYAMYGLVKGTWILAIVGVCCSVGFLLWLRIFPRTKLGARISNKAALPSSLAQKRQMVGAQGVALSALRPAGVAQIEGKRRDVVTDGSFIESKTPVIVVAEEGQKLVVRALSSYESSDSNFNPP